jgi:predicted CXXCH cytochrome family protein
MKRAFFLMLGSAVWFVMATGTAAFADNGTHGSGLGVYGGLNGTANPATDRCSGCHRAHTAQGPDITVAEQPALCYTCHGAGGAGASTDVQDGNAYTGEGASQAAAGALRGGGFDNAWIDSGNFSNTLYLSGTSYRLKNKTIPVAGASAPATSSHKIGVSSTMWGNTASGPGQTGVALECTSCHDPHGNGNYRILKPVPDGSGAAAPGVVIQDTLSPKVYTLTDYWLGTSKADGTDTNATTHGPQLGVNGDQVFKGTQDGTGAWVSQTGGVPTTTTLPSASKPLDGFIQNVSNWCTTCHTSYKTVDPVTGLSLAVLERHVQVPARRHQRQVRQSELHHVPRGTRIQRGHVRPEFEPDRVPRRFGGDLHVVGEQRWRHRLGQPPAAVRQRQLHDLPREVRGA